MQSNILWTGIEYYSLENCLINVSANGTEVLSSIVGMYEEKLYQVQYRIVADENWRTRLVEIDARHDDRLHEVRLEADGLGSWKQNGQMRADYGGCIDVDLPLTPFTNTLPINRLRLSVNSVQLIRVIYLDLLRNNFSVVTQKYQRLSTSIYQYENVPNDFEAQIEVDKSGYVINYPSLFTRMKDMESFYQLNDLYQR